MADSYKLRMDAINQLVDDQKRQESERLNRESMSNWSEAFTNIGNQAHKPLTTAAHIMSRSRPNDQIMQRSNLAPQMRQLNADSARDILDRYKAADARGRVLQEYEQAKRKKEYQDARNTIEWAKLNKGKAVDPLESDYKKMRNEKLRAELDDKKNPTRGSVSSRVAKMSGEGQKRFSLTASGLQAIDDLADAMYNLDSSKISLIGDNPYTFARDRFVEALARLHSGAAITDYEFDMYKGMVPTIKDVKSGMADRKIKAMMSNMSSKLMAMGFEPNEVRDLNKSAAESSSGYIDAIANKAKQKPGTAYADDKPVDDYDNMSDEELEKLMKERGLQ